MFRFRKFCPFQTRSPVPAPEHDTNFLNYDSFDMSFLTLERTALNSDDVPTTRPNTSRSRVFRAGPARSAGQKKKRGKLITNKKVL